MPPNILDNVNEIIAQLGGTSATARFFKVKPSGVVYWRKKGIPSYRVDYLRLARPDLAPLLPKESRNG